MIRRDREKETVRLMITMYCRGHHRQSGDELCEECRQLLEYAHRRIDRCPKGSAKSSCRQCEIHCYAPDKREKIREVMRYAGPRMPFTHPGMALRHMLAELGGKFRLSGLWKR